MTKTEVKSQDENQMYKKYLKRSIDAVASTCLLVFLFPFILFIVMINAIVVRGNPFFIQDRVGRGLVTFRIIKLKTMVPQEKIKSNANWSHGNVEFTLIGEWLRKWSIDEVPTLFNVFVGDMSLIGPRPLLMSHVETYRQKDFARHSVRPGITGLAQTKGRNSISWTHRYDYDSFYVRHYNFKMDAGIMLETISVVIRQYGHQSFGDHKRVENNAE